MTRPGSSTVRATGRRSLLWIAIVVGLLVVGAVVGAPTVDEHSLDPTSTAANGTKALVDLLDGSGAQVEVLDTTPDDSTDIAVLLADSTSTAMTDELQRWVEQGGTLVVADPRSSFTATPVSDTSVFGAVHDTLAPGDCSIAAMAGIDRVEPAGGVVYDVAPRASGCFTRDDGAFVVDVPTGDGHIVSVGGASTFTNQNLGTDDNAALAVALMAPREGTSVAVLYGMSPDGTSRATGISHLISPGVRFAMLEVLVAFLIFAWWRGRRLGQPVLEPQLVQIGGSELVAAVGNLMQQTHDPDRAARLLRADLRRRLAERLGLPPTSSAEVIAEVTSARSGVDRDVIARAVTDVPIRSEDELLDLARDIDRIRTEVLHGTAP